MEERLYKLKKDIEQFAKDYKIKEFNVYVNYCEYTTGERNVAGIDINVGV